MIDVAREAAEAACVILRDTRPDQVRHKSTIDLVTEVDLACEHAIREVLAQRTPGIPVLAEEGGGARDADTRWVVDPLDGTTNFVHGLPWYAVSVGLEVDGRGEVGVVAQPHRVFHASRGQGAFCDDAPIRVSDRSDMATCLIATGFPYDRHERAEVYLAYVKMVLERARGLRRVGAAALDLAMVAAGVFDGFWEFDLQSWDVCAGQVLVEEAGGRVTAHDGGVVDRQAPAPLATNGRIHDQMIALLEQAA